jgi:NAD(P)-dependent dehydrogenase (short-subunit alcohol dehydrogenase family)
MMPLLEGKIVFISGGSQGFGSRELRAPQYAKVPTWSSPAVVASPERSFVAELAEQGTTARFVQADVSDVAQAPAAVQAAVAEFGRIDCLVNSAGLTTRGTLLDTTPELFDDTSP